MLLLSERASPLESLKIWDTETTIDLLSQGPYGIKYGSWNPNLPLAKGGGVRAASPLNWGSRLVMKQWEDAVDTFHLVVMGTSPDDKTERIQELRRLLEKGEEYWKTEFQQDPVILEVRQSCETNTRYSIIKGYQTPNDTDPFIEPYNVDNDFILIVTHGPWFDQPPFEKTCVKLATEHTTCILNSVRALPVDSEDDASVNVTDSLIFLGLPDLLVGYSAATEYGFGVRFQATGAPPVPVPVGATIISAVLSLEFSAVDVGATSVLIRGELDAAPAVFSTYANYAARVRTVASQEVIILKPTAIGDHISLYNLEEILQEIVDLPGWAGGDIVLFLSYVQGTDTVKRFSSVDTAGPMIPTLDIEYTLPGPTYGEPTPECSPENARVTNFERYRNINWIYSYDASVPSFSANLQGSAVPYNLLPAVPAIGDILYIGADTTLSLAQRFMNLTFNVTGGQQFSGVWEYWSGAAWVALSVLSTYTDTTYGLLTSGKGGVFWNTPNVVGWAATAINGKTAYWMRYRITAVGGAPVAPTQLTSGISAVTWAHVVLEDTQIKGDLPARVRTHMENSRNLDIAGPNPQRVLVGSRSLRRGEGFQMWLNAGAVAANQENPSIVQYTSASASWTAAVDADAPINYSVYYNPAGASSDYLRWRINQPLSLDYQGIYRVFLRFHNVSGNAGTTVQFMSGTSYKTPYGYSMAPYYTGLVVPIGTSTRKYHIVDLGVHKIPPVPVDKDEDYPSGVLVGVNVANLLASPQLRIFDLCLFPVDEFVSEMVVPSIASSTISYYGGIGPQTLGLATVVGEGRIDSLWTRRSVLGGIYLPGTDNFLAPWQVSTGEFHGLQANASQAQYFFMLQYDTSDLVWYANPFMCLNIKDWALYQYLSSRGAR